MNHLQWVAVGAGLVGMGLVVRGAVRHAQQEGSGASLALRAPDVPEQPAKPVSVSAGEAALHRSMRPVIVAAFEQATGRKPTLAELQYVSAVAWLETRDGTGWPANMAGAHNWGAVQCDTKKEGPETCIPHKDHDSGGGEFAVGFKRYASDVDGAADVVKHVIRIRPRTAAALAEKNPSAYRASYAMRREHYYGGICATAMKTKGVSQQQAARSFSKPDESEATKACAEDTIGQHANIVMRNAQAIAQTLGEPVALRLGTYADADNWWRNGAAA